MNQVKNGAFILMDRRIDDGHIVLCYKDDDELTPFVTWVTDNDYNCFLGHYFHKLDAAMDDYNCRN
jgi:hypothetical protein